MRNKKGFTLIELLVAMSILSIGFLGAATLVVGIMKGNYHAKKVTTASILAQDKLEDMVNAGYPSAVDSSAGYNVMPEFRSFRRVTSVSLNTPQPDMKTIHIEVFWKNDAHSVVVKSILTP